MPRRQKEPLRPRTPAEYAQLLHISRAQSEPAAVVAHAKALPPGHAGGQPQHYAAPERERILAEVRRAPDREADGTATWTLSALRRALRRAPDGLPQVSISTIWGVLHDAGYTWQQDRSWCETGAAVRKRKAGAVTVHDPDAEAKKS